MNSFNNNGARKLKFGLHEGRQHSECNGNDFEEISKIFGGFCIGMVPFDRV